MYGKGGTCLQTVLHEVTGTCHSLEAYGWQGIRDVYQQLRDEEKADANKIKSALYVALVMDKFVAYEQFIVRQMQPERIH